MTTMKEISGLSEKDLIALVKTNRETIQKHRFGMGGRDVMAARTAKQTVARALTELAARNRAETK